MSSPAFSADQLRVLDQRIRRTLHPKQSDFAFDDAKFVSALCGRGAGKSVGLLMRLIRRMMWRPDSNCLFIAATRASAERLVWSLLKMAMTNLRVPGVVFNESKLTCSLSNGSRLILFGADDKADVNRLRGISYNEVGVDETGSIRIDLLKELLTEVIGPRLIGSMCLVGTPGKRLEGMFFDVTRPGSEQHRPYADRDQPEFDGWTKWSSHRWAVMDGAAAGIQPMQEFLKIAELQKKNEGWSDSNPVWLREYCAVWAEDNTANVYVFRPYDEAGNEWNLWSPTLDAKGFAIHPIPKTDLGIAIGIDVGWKDSFALTVFAFSYADPARLLYQIYEVNKTRQYANTIAKMLIGDELSHDRYGGIIGHLGWPDVIVGDFAGSGGALLEELKIVYGINVAPADKALRMKENSIELFNSDLYDGRIKVIKGSVLAAQLGTLQWSVDQFGKRTETKSQSNDACDSALYARNALVSLLPSVSAPTEAGPPQRRAPAQDPDDIVAPPEPAYGDADSMYSNSEW